MKGDSLGTHLPLNFEYIFQRLSEDSCGNYGRPLNNFKVALFRNPLFLKNLNESDHVKIL